MDDVQLSEYYIDRNGVLRLGNYAFQVDGFQLTEWNDDIIVYSSFDDD